MMFDAFHLTATQGPCSPLLLPASAIVSLGVSHFSCPHPACLEPNFIPERQTPALPHVSTPPWSHSALACLSLWLVQDGLTMLSPVAITPSHHFVC